MRRKRYRKRRVGPPLTEVEQSIIKQFTDTLELTAHDSRMQFLEAFFLPDLMREAARNVIERTEAVTTDEQSIIQKEIDFLTSRSATQAGFLKLEAINANPELPNGIIFVAIEAILSMGEIAESEQEWQRGARAWISTMNGEYHVKEGVGLILNEITASRRWMVKKS